MRLRRRRDPYREPFGDVLIREGEQMMRRRHWMGVSAMQNPVDAWMYQEVIHETRPEVIVELGNFHGGSTLFLAHLLDLLGSGTVVAVDLSHDEFRADHHRIVTVTGDTAAQETIERVSGLCDGKRAMVIHDADHHAPAVLRDLRNYSPLVSSGCYLIVEDSVADALPKHLSWDEGPGPLVAAREFLAESPEFEVDHKRSPLLSGNPGGYLRRR